MPTILAYVDPGSGLMVFQMISAAFVGCILSLRKVRGWVKRQVFRIKEQPADER